MAFKKLKLWFDLKLAKDLVQKIENSGGQIDSKVFLNKLKSQLDKLELKDRVALLAKRLDLSLPGVYNDKVRALLLILGPENKEESGMFKKYYWIMPIAKFVEDFGLDNFKSSMKIIEEITKRNTGEYCIRPFFKIYPNETIAQMKMWSKSKNKHLRRLSSEGLRPRLPWSQILPTLIEDPSPILPILEQLKDDHSRYVQKSVANCLNDILKDNFPTAKEIIENWSKEASLERKWIIKHALRNLVKKEDPWALKLMSTMKY